MADAAGFEPTAFRLTVGRSAVELCANGAAPLATGTACAQTGLEPATSTLTVVFCPLNYSRMKGIEWSRPSRELALHSNLKRCRGCRRDLPQTRLGAGGRVELPNLEHESKRDPVTTRQEAPPGEDLPHQGANPVITKATRLWSCFVGAHASERGTGPGRVYGLPEAEEQATDDWAMKPRPALLKCTRAFVQKPLSMPEEARQDPQFLHERALGQAGWLPPPGRD